MSQNNNSKQYYCLASANYNPFFIRFLLQTLLHDTRTRHTDSRYHIKSIIDVKSLNIHDNGYQRISL
jgi:hypothetical protein